jgi:hypothetical protein
MMLNRSLVFLVCFIINSNGSLQAMRNIKKLFSSFATQELPDLSPEILAHIASFLPGTHPLVREAIRGRVFPLTNEIARNIVEAFMQKCVKELRNHKLDKPLSAIFRSSIEDSTIYQPKKFVVRKNKFINRISNLFAYGSEQNQALLNKLFEVEVRNQFSEGTLALPRNCEDTITVRLPMEGLFLQENGVLLAIAASRDEATKTSTIIYSSEKDKELIQKLLPSLPWPRGYSVLLGYLSPSSPYYRKIKSLPLYSAGL